MRVLVTSLNVGLVRKKRHVGKAAIPRRDVPPSPASPPTTRKAGRARVGQAIGKARPLEQAKTNVIKQNTNELTQPIFVDPSGSRRRRLRWIAYLVGAVLVVALVLLWFSQFGRF
jgi:type II secretory pathway component PulL